MKLDNIDPTAKHHLTPYDRSIDIWTLAICTVEMIMNGGYSWNRFGPCKHRQAPKIPDPDERGYVTIERFSRYREALDTMLDETGNDHQKKQLPKLCRQMTTYDPMRRLTSGWIVEIIDRIMAGSQFLETGKIQFRLMQTLA